MRPGRRGTIKPIPLRCGCVVAEFDISFCSVAKQLWDQSAQLQFFARQAESAKPWKAFADAYQAYKSHFKKE